MKASSSHATLLLLCCYPAIAFLSWLAAIVVPQWDGHSLLSAEGLRHIATHTTQALTHPCLAILLLTAFAIRCAFCTKHYANTSDAKHTAKENNLPAMPAPTDANVYRWLAVEAILWLCLVTITCLLPDAPFRGIDGGLWTGALPQAAPYLLLLLVIILNTTWTCFHSGRRSWKGVCSVWTEAMKAIAPFIIPAMLLFHVIMCGRFTFFP